MRIFDDRSSIELEHPIDEELWKVITDAELDNTEHIYFTTLSGKRVDFIKTNVLDKIRAEIIELRSRQNVGVLECLEILDKYKKESEGE